VRETDTVEVAVLDDTRGPRLHAVVRDDVREFMQRQLYGDRNRRAPAATLSSLKPTGGRFGPASNFATVPAAPPGEAYASAKKKKKKKASGQGAAAGGYSSLERMAAKIMQQGRAGKRRGA